jgi:hypothetical protein
MHHSGEQELRWKVATGSKSTARIHYQRDMTARPESSSERSRRIPDWQRKAWKRFPRWPDRPEPAERFSGVLGDDNENVASTPLSILCSRSTEKRSDAETLPRPSQWAAAGYAHGHESELGQYLFGCGGRLAASAFVLSLDVG